MLNGLGLKQIAFFQILVKNVNKQIYGYISIKTATHPQKKNSAGQKSNSHSNEIFQIQNLSITRLGVTIALIILNSPF